MLKTGLVSITFRKLDPQQIVEQASRAGLDGVEWGGDIHVPHGDVKQAERVGQLTRQAGLAVAAYGSYYRVGHDEPVPFGEVLDTATALQAPVIRVWAGKTGSAEASEEYRRKVIDETGRVAELAAPRGITIAYEWHGNTLTDTRTSAIGLLESRRRPNVETYWQPPVGMPDADCQAGLEAALPYLRHLHVFHWAGHDRRPLAEGADRWRRFFRAAAGPAAGGEDRYAMLEFVRDDDVAAFAEDAATLGALIAETAGHR